MKLLFPLRNEHDTGGSPPPAASAVLQTDDSTPVQLPKPDGNLPPGDGLPPAAPLTEGDATTTAAVPVQEPPSAPASPPKPRKRSRGRWTLLHPVETDEA